MRSASGALHFRSLGLLTLAAACGCWDLSVLTSAHPTYDSGDLVSDNRLLGVWVAGGDDTMVIMERGPGHYVAMDMAPGEDSVLRSVTLFDLHRYQLGGEAFIDWQVVSERDGMVLHVPMLVRVESDTLRFIAFDDDPLRDSSTWAADSVPRFATEESDVTLRGSLEGIQSFLRRYAADTSTHIEIFTFVRLPLGAGPEAKPSADLVACGALWSPTAGCGRRATPKPSVTETFPGIDSTSALVQDTAISRVSVRRDTLWPDLDRPYVAHIASKYRVMLWLCSRDAVRLVFYSIVEADWPRAGHQFSIVSYQLAPEPIRTDTFRLRDPNWMEREVRYPDLSRLGLTTDLRVQYEAEGQWPSAGDWRIVLSDSARSVLREWADSCAHGRW